MSTPVRRSPDAPYDDPDSTSIGWSTAVVAPVLALAERLRAAGLAVSTSEVLDAVAGLAEVDVARRTQVRAALRATLLKDAAHDTLFGHAFDAVFPRPARSARGTDGAAGWGGSDDTGSGSGVAEPADADPAARLARALHEHDDETLQRLLADAVSRFAGTEEGRSVEHHTQRTLRRMDLTRVYRRLMAEQLGKPSSELDRSTAGADADAELARLRQEVADLVAERLRHAHGEDSVPLGAELSDVPLLDASPDVVQALRQALRPLARRLASQLGRRHRHGRGALDMRRTIRRSMGTGGAPVQPVLRRRRPTRPDLVLLCDVSGSIAEYVPFALTLLHAVHREFTRVRSFVFVDGVVDVTEVLATSPGVLDPRLFLDRRGLVAGDGRSDYARAFAAFLARYGDLVTARTTTVVIGDARSHDRRPAVAELRELAYRSRRLYWLNPEPRHEWDTADSRVSSYGTHCTSTFEVATLRQLADAVARIA